MSCNSKSDDSLISEKSFDIKKLHSEELNLDYATDPQWTKQVLLDGWS